ncbi:hypothetical protein I302_107769 [Kwoniella bestiolae CBS 10118]|uniref:Uncharacterized protein n=1 Tax=Kwoniella bestiolae CBS 10118 TaxID=1296100 RepID=A0A1B9FXK9_9TREE|nr:hypothetical protein I302_06492 [Kwoniella bestiolae CBS 10118]OCF23509.1 hypothetical protein I302_06492 [Kwoniella bestiolae CBS 10118]
MSDTSDLASLFGPSSSTSSSSPPTPPSPQLSRTPDIDSIRQLAKKSFWEIEYELNTFAKTQGYTYLLKGNDILAGRSRTFRLVCSRHIFVPDCQEDTKESKCNYVLDFRYEKERDTHDPLSGPFVLVMDGGLLDHNHAPIEAFLNWPVFTIEEKKTMYRQISHQNNTRATRAGSHIQLHTQFSPSISTDNSEKSSISLPEKDKDNRNGDQDEQSEKQDGSIEEAREKEDVPWKLNFDPLNHHIQRLKMKLRDSEDEIVKEEGDEYRRKYEELKAITREQQGLMEDDRKKRKVYEESQVDSAEKKRKLDERWLALMED